MTAEGITARYALTYVGASKREKGQLLDEVASATGWSRDNARRQLTAAAKRARGEVGPERRQPRRYSPEAVKALRVLWRASGEQCGKYLAVSLPTILAALERHGELVVDPLVRTELLAMSPATIDRQLAGARGSLRAVSVLPSRRRSLPDAASWPDGLESEPGIVSGEVLPHSEGWILHLTDVDTGWSHYRSLPDLSSETSYDALSRASAALPFGITALTLDHPDARIRAAVDQWSEDHGVLPLDIARTPEPAREGRRTTQLGFAPDLWRLAEDRHNFFTPIRRPVNPVVDDAGRRRRRYDAPKSPVDRLLEAQVLSPAQQRELHARRAGLNPAEMSRQIERIAGSLRSFAATSPA